MTEASLRFCQPANDMDAVDPAELHGRAAREQVERYLCRRLEPYVAASIIEQALQTAGLSEFPAYDPERERFIRSDLRATLARRLGPAQAQALNLERWGSTSMAAPPSGVQRRPSSDPPARPSEPPSDRRSWLAGHPAEPETWIGSVLQSRYRIVQKVADGFRGELFRAERIGADAGKPDVAIKLVRPLLIQDRAVFEERFEEEALTARRLTQRHSLRVFEHGVTDDGMFLVTEWLDGVNLSQHLTTCGTMSTHRAMGLASQICNSLAEAHALGITHGDLSPDSVFICPAGKHKIVKVMDYGRRRMESWTDDGHSQVDLPTDWARYLAPEQITGADCDPRSDVYSVGALLYRVLSGKLPFENTSGIGILMAQVYEEPTPLKQHLPEVADPVADLVMACLQKDPDARPQNAAALIKSLDLGLSR